MRDWRSALFRLALTGLFVGLLVWRVNVANAFRTLADVQWWWAVLAMLVFSASKYVHAVRWRVFLGPETRAPINGLFGIFLISNMANMVMPLRAGDVIRILVAGERYRVPKAQMTAVVIVVETLLDGVTFTLLLLLALAFLEIPGFPTEFFWAVAGIVAGTVLATVAFARLAPAWEVVPLAHRVPPLLRRVLHGLVPPFVEGLVAFRKGSVGFLSLAISFPAWLTEVAVFALFGQAFGLDLSLGEYVAVMITANLAISLPLAPGGYGPYELAVQEVVAAFGVDRTVAAGYAIGTHMAMNAWILVTGLVALWATGISWREVLTLGGGARGEARTETAPVAPLDDAAPSKPQRV